MLKKFGLKAPVKETEKPKMDLIRSDRHCPDDGNILLFDWKKKAIAIIISKLMNRFMRVP